MVQDQDRSCGKKLHKIQKNDIAMWCGPVVCNALIKASRLPTGQHINTGTDLKPD